MEEGGVEVEHMVKQKGWLAGEGRCCDPCSTDGINGMENQHWIRLTAM